MDRRPPDEGRRPGGEPTGRPGSGQGCRCGERGTQRGDELRRAAEQQRVAERSAADRAEIAAAEDFDPLRIRPYVTLGVDETPATDDEPQRQDSHSRPAGDPATTMPLLLGRQTAGPPQDAVETAEAGGATAALPSLAPNSAQYPAPPFAPPPAAGAASASGPAPAAPFAPDADPVRPRRRRPFAALAVGTAVIAAVGTAAFAGGLFDGSDNGDADRETALPTTVASIPGASVPAKESAPAPASPPPSGTVSASPSVPASASPSASASPPPSASATSQPATTPPPASTPPASRPAPVAPPAPPAGPTLRPGDQGPEVAELQRRLEEIWLFHGRDDGDYTGQVEHAVTVYQSYKAIEGDQPGVYGPRTRRALEAETTGRGRS
ncbi:peptidoglycan-binding protein [Streptomyces sp. NPDC057729]|uniref:peptidoglycan-binding domain-containing protein n=1 Tax=Streptomyces sp. NPDC057729 TaxID=3346230 RepID=UPI00368F4C2F